MANAHKPEVFEPLLNDRYRLEDAIGEGGSACVYRAFDVHLGRYVALKVLHPHVVATDQLRFEREIRALAQISHPGIVSILDFGRDAQGRLFLVMPLLMGGSFHDLGPVENSPEHIETFLSASFRVLDALAYLHGQTMVHRDLTPRNILFGLDGCPRLMDFGLIHFTDELQELTRTGYTLGTPEYMAPEQAKGGEVSSASDMYAFGAVMYRVLTGRVPFEGDNDQSVLYQHVYETPVKPIERNPALPDALSDAILSFLEKDPTRRPASGVEACNVLRHAQQQMKSEHFCGQYRGGKARTGVHSGGIKNPVSLSLDWTLSLGTELAWPGALVANPDLLVLGGRNRKLHLISPSGCSFKTIEADDEITAPALLSPNRVTFGTWKGTVYHCDLLGNTLWKCAVGDEIHSTPLDWKGALIVPSRRGEIHSLDVETGQSRWVYAAEGPVVSSPLVWKNTLIVADEQGWIHGIEAHTGQFLWKIEVGSVNATPAIAFWKGIPVLVVPCWSGEVHALVFDVRGQVLMPKEDPLLWTFDLGGAVWGSPALYNGHVYIGSWSGCIHALSLDSGDELWNANLDSRLTSSPIFSEGIVYQASEGGKVCAFRAQDGRMLWSHSSETGIQTTPLIAHQKLYVASMDGVVHAFK